MGHNSMLRAALAASLIIAGCDSEDDEQPINSAPASITLNNLPDTLLLDPGEKVATPVVVRVLHSQGEQGVGVSGDVIGVSIGDDRLATFEFADPTLLNTTNDDGRIFLWLWTTGSEGTIELTATIRDLEARESTRLSFRPGSVGSLNIAAFPDVLFGEFGGDQSAEISVSIADVNQIAVSEVYLPLRATGGILIPPPPTDFAGRAQTIWRPLDSFGKFHIIVTAGDQADTVIVNVVEPYH